MAKGGAILIQISVCSLQLIRTGCQSGTTALSQTIWIVCFRICHLVRCDIPQCFADSKLFWLFFFIKLTLMASSAFTRCWKAIGGADTTWPIAARLSHVTWTHLQHDWTSPTGWGLEQISSSPPGGTCVHFVNKWNAHEDSRFHPLQKVSF